MAEATTTTIVQSVNPAFNSSSSYSEAVKRMASLPLNASEYNTKLFNEGIQALLEGGVNLIEGKNTTLVTDEVVRTLCDASTWGPRAKNLREEGVMHLLGEIMQTDAAKKLQPGTVQTALNTFALHMGRKESEVLLTGEDGKGHNFNTVPSGLTVGDQSSRAIYDIVRNFDTNVWKPIGPKLFETILAGSGGITREKANIMGEMVYRDSSLLTPKIVEQMFSKANQDETNFAEAISAISNTAHSYKFTNEVPIGAEKAPTEALKAMVKNYTALLPKVDAKSEFSISDAAAQSLQRIADAYRGPVWDNELKPFFMSTAKSQGIEDIANTVLDKIAESSWQENAPRIDSAQIPVKPAAPGLR